MSLLKSLYEKKNQLFFGWWIVLGSYVVQVLNGALLFHAFSAYILPLQAEFGWSRASVSGVFSMVRAESGILGPLQGWLIERCGPKIMMQVGIAFFGAGYIYFSHIDSLWDFYLSFALIALGSSLGGFIPISATITHWFARQRATALGISMTGMGVGGLLVPLVVWSLTHWGWRDTAFFSGLLIFCLGFPATLLMRQRPELYGLRPDGDYGARRSGGRSSCSRRAALHSRPSPAHTDFLVSVDRPQLGALCRRHRASTPDPAHGRTHWHVTRGRRRQCNLIAGLYYLRPAGGWIGDRADKRLVMVTCMWMHAVALVLFAFATSQFETTLFAAIHGTAWGVRGTLINAIRGDYFGRASYALISGFASLVIMVGMTTGPLFAGYLHDLTGSYQQAFIVLAGCSALGSLALILARKPAAPNE